MVAPLGSMSRQDTPSIGNACAMMAQALCRSNIGGAAMSSERFHGRSSLLWQKDLG